MSPYKRELYRILPGNILLRKTSLVDFPGRVSSVFFFAGCNLRCPWCHNRELVLGGVENLVTIDDALAHIKKRRFVLGGVVLSGGEPCIREELPFIIEEIKKNGLQVKLDTNGMFPAVLENLFRRKETCPDYIAMDFKLAPDRYAQLLPRAAEKNTSLSENAPGENLVKSAVLVRASDIDHEYRTLVLPGSFITEKDIEALAPLADNAPWYFRYFRGGNCLDPAWDNLEECAAEAETKAAALAEKARELGKNAVIRQA